MSKEFTHTIDVPTTRDSARIPLRITLTARFDNDGTIDTWGLAVNGLQQSPNNRTALRRIMHGPTREALPGGDRIGAEWLGSTEVQVWTKDYTWKVATKKARAMTDEIDMMIGRWAEEMKPKIVPMPTAPSDDRDARIAELEAENQRLRELVRFLEQYRPR
jgi:hypothetical protein